MPANSQSDQKSYGYIIILGVGLSLFLSWLSVRNNYVLSPDSLLYIFTARTFLDDGLMAAVDTYRWPMLSIIIANIHNLTGLSLINAGYCLIASFYAGICWTFISIIRDLGGDDRNLLIALIIISFFPTLNDYRDYISRDPGFWLFSLLSLQQLIRFSANQHLKHAFSWFIFVLAAIMFRTEALFFAAFAPFALLLDPHLHTRQKLQKSAVLYGLLTSSMILGLLFIANTPVLSEKLRLFSELSNLSTFATQLTVNFKDTIRVISEAKPYIHFVEDINAIFILGLSGLVLYTILHALTLPYLLILCWPSKGDKSTHNQTITYAITYLLIIISYLMIKTFHGMFTTDRYCLTAALIIMLALPFKVTAIWENANYLAQRFNWRKTIVVLLLLYPVLDTLINSDSDKKYIADAAEWVAEQHSLDQRLLTNHKQIAVLGANCLTSCFIDNNFDEIQWGDLSQYNQLAIRIKHKQTTQEEGVTKLLASGDWQLVKTFTNLKNDKVIILSRQPSTHTSSQ